MLSSSILDNRDDDRNKIQTKTALSRQIVKSHISVGYESRAIPQTSPTYEVGDYKFRFHMVDKPAPGETTDKNTMLFVMHGINTYELSFSPKTGRLKRMDSRFGSNLLEEREFTTEKPIYLKSYKRNNLHNQKMSYTSLYDEHGEEIMHVAKPGVTLEQVIAKHTDLLDEKTLLTGLYLAVETHNPAYPDTDADINRQREKLLKYLNRNTLG